MSRYADWISKAVEPTSEEMARVMDPVGDELRDAARIATTPTDAELHRLLMTRATVQARLEAERGSLTAGWAWSQPAALGGAGLLAAAAIALLTIGSGPVAYGDVALSVGEAHLLSAADVLELGPAIDVTAEGRLRIDQADERGTFVTLLDGHASFDVAPGADYRHLVVRANDTEVEVKGTVFDVALVNGEVAVSVDHGMVEVRHGGEAFYLSTGEQWTVPEAVVRLDVTGPAEPAVAPVVDDASREPAVADAVEAALPSADGAGLAADAQPADKEVEPAPEGVKAYEPGTPSEPRPQGDTYGSTISFTRAHDAAKRALDNPNPSREALLTALAGVSDVLDKKALSTSERAEAEAFGLLLESRTGTDGGVVGRIDAYRAAHPHSSHDASLLLGKARLANAVLGDKALALRTYQELQGVNAPPRMVAEAQAWQGILAHELGDDKQAAIALEQAIHSGSLDDADLMQTAIATCEATRRCAVRR